jgi:hypothetical protein
MGEMIFNERCRFLAVGSLRRISFAARTPVLMASTLRGCADFPFSI